MVESGQKKNSPAKKKFPMFNKPYVMLISIKKYQQKNFAKKIINVFGRGCKGTVKCSPFINLSLPLSVTLLCLSNYKTVKFKRVRI